MRRPRLQRDRRQRAQHRADLLRDYGPAGALTGGLALALLLVLPARPASADLGTTIVSAGESALPGVGPLLSLGVGAAGGAITSLASSAAVQAFVDILNALFGGIAASITAAVLTWLTTITIQTTGSVASLYNLTSGMAMAFIGLVLVLSMATFYLSGITPSGSGGFEALEGIARTVGAVFFVLAWPYVFHHVIGLVNIASQTVLQNPALKAQIAHLLTGLVFIHFTPAAPFGLFIDIIMAIAGVLLFLGLMFMKVMLGATLTFLFIAMPLAIVAWPVSALAWLTRAAMGAFLALILIPFIWTLVFATFAAVSSNAVFSFGGGGNPVDIFLQKTTEAMVAVAMLTLTLTIPRALLRMATNGIVARGPGVGSKVASTAGRVATYVAARQATEFVSTKLGGGAKGAGQQRNPANQTTPSGQQNGAPNSTTVGGTAGPAKETPAEIDSRRRAAAAARAAGRVGPVVTGAAGAGAGPGPGAPAGGAVPGPGPAAAGAEAAAAGAGAAALAARAAAGAGRVHAVGPSVGATRPAEDQPDMASQRPVGPTSADAKTPLAQALEQAQSGRAPTPGEARAALARLGPEMQQRIDSAYASGGPTAVRNDLAMLSTSDAISNAQAADALAIATAADHGHGVPGVSPPSSSPGPAPPTGPDVGRPTGSPVISQPSGASDSRASVRSAALGGNGGDYAFNSQSPGGSPGSAATAPDAPSAASLAPAPGYPTPALDGGFAAPPPVAPPPVAPPSGPPAFTPASTPAPAPPEGGFAAPPPAAPPSGPVLPGAPTTQSRPPSASADARDASLADEGFRSHPREKKS